MRRSQVLVAGGGPAGSVAATLLAREGVEVTLVERAKHPRYHIGESLLTSALPMFEFMGVKERIERHGFNKKYGGYFRIKHGDRPGHLDFTKLSKYRHSYQVVRSEFDQLLFEHARESGARALEETAVAEVEFDGGRPVAAKLTGNDGSEERLAFDHIVDATGLAGLLTTRYFKNRREEEAFANVAVGGYFRGALPYRDDAGVEHPTDFAMEALVDGSGWIWAIPLHDGLLSVGVVLHRDAYRERFKEQGSNLGVFEWGLSASRDIPPRLESATREGEIRVWRDYSYFAAEYAGPGYRLAGDAAGFIDPLFSTGVHMAFLGGLSAAATICSEIRGDLEAQRLERFHHRCLSQAYTRFAVTVAGFYRQLHDQREVMLPGISADNFQLAFDLIRPVISGDVDLNSDALSDEALENAMRYTTDMMLEGHEITTGNKVASMMLTQAIDDRSGQRPLDAIDGLYIRMKRGQLGIGRLNAMESAAAGLRRHLIRGVFAEVGRV